LGILIMCTLIVNSSFEKLANGAPTIYRNVSVACLTCLITECAS
jgi:hypothetical protein